MKKILVSIALSLCLLVPAFSNNTTIVSNEPYVAVFASSDFPKSDWDEPYTPDKILYAKDWCELELFLMSVKNHASGRPILLDLQVHGLERLALKDEKLKEGYSEADFGYVVEEISKILGEDNIIVICEACFSGYVYKNTIRDNPDRKGSHTHSGDFNRIPAFPIYGVGDRIESVNNIQYMQYYHKVFYRFMDLREYEWEPLGLRDFTGDSQEFRVLRELRVFLRRNRSLK